MHTTVLAVDDIRRIVLRVGLDGLMDETIQRLTAALEAYDPSQTFVAVRDGFTYSRPNIGLLEWMPVLEPGGSATIKTVAYHPANPNLRGLPTILSTIGVFDSESGHLAGLVDGTYITALRTGAASAIASRVLAWPNSRTLGLIGCGAQAVTQLHALCRSFDLHRVLIHDSDPAVVASFERRVSRFYPAGLSIEIAPLDVVVLRSDILCTQTSVEVGRGPVFADQGMLPHVHVNSVGSDLPGKVELPISLLLRSFVCPDFVEQARKEGECQLLAPDAIGPSLAEIVKAPERYRAQQMEATVFDSTGFALEDHVTARMLLDYAAEFGFGTAMEIESTTDDPWDPYEFADSENTGVRAEHPPRLALAPRTTAPSSAPSR